MLGACADTEIRPASDTIQGQTTGYDRRAYEERQRTGSLFGPNALTFSSRRDPSDEANGGGIGVNAYLWRGSLETVDFIPLTSADPFGGLIITDWFQSSDTPNERVKVQILIRDTTLRADGVKAFVYRQVRDEQGDWLDAPVDPQTGRGLEDRILTRARELRIASVEATS
ncbi:MAG: DUF3576 domain-containing protein [Pseudomonadota bacterium]